MGGDGEGGAWHKCAVSRLQLLDYGYSICSQLSASAAKVGHAWMQQRGDSAGAGCRAMGGGRGYWAQAARKTEAVCGQRGKRALSRPLRVPRHAGPGKRRSGYKTIGGPAGLRATSFLSFQFPAAALKKASLIVAVARRCTLSRTRSSTHPPRLALDPLYFHTRRN